VSSTPKEAGGVSARGSEEAAVVFEGTVKSVEVINVTRDERGIVLNCPPDTIIAGVDPEWLLKVDVRRVRKGGVAWSGLKGFAIHSPVRTLIMTPEEAVGKSFVFFLRGTGEGRPNEFIGLDAESLQNVPLP